MFVNFQGKYVTSRNLRDRLYRELERNLAMKVEDGETADTFVVSGRGTLHITILIENMSVLWMFHFSLITLHILQIILHLQAKRRIWIHGWASQSYQQEGGWKTVGTVWGDFSIHLLLLFKSKKSKVDMTMHELESYLTDLEI